MSHKIRVGMIKKTVPLQASNKVLWTPHSIGHSQTAAATVLQDTPLLASLRLLHMFPVLPSLRRLGRWPCMPKSLQLPYAFNGSGPGGYVGCTPPISSVPGGLLRSAGASTLSRFWLLSRLFFLTLTPSGLHSLHFGIWQDHFLFHLSPPSPLSHSGSEVSPSITQHHIRYYTCEGTLNIHPLFFFACNQTSAYFQVIFTILWI